MENDDISITVINEVGEITEPTGMYGNEYVDTREPYGERNYDKVHRNNVSRSNYRGRGRGRFGGKNYHQSYPHDDRRALQSSDDRRRFDSYERRSPPSYRGSRGRPYSNYNDQRYEKPYYERPYPSRPSQNESRPVMKPLDTMPRRRRSPDFYNYDPVNNQNGNRTRTPSPSTDNEGFRSPSPVRSPAHQPNTEEPVFAEVETEVVQEPSSPVRSISQAAQDILDEIDESVMDECDFNIEDYMDENDSKNEQETNEKTEIEEEEEEKEEKEKPKEIKPQKPKVRTLEQVLEEEFGDVSKSGNTEDEKETQSDEENDESTSLEETRKLLAEAELRFKKLNNPKKRKREPKKPKKKKTKKPQEPSREAHSNNLKRRSKRRIMEKLVNPKEQCILIVQNAETNTIEFYDTHKNYLSVTTTEDGNWDVRNNSLSTSKVVGFSDITRHRIKRIENYFFKPTVCVKE